ncbi:MAG: von Willebrand factor type A domain-containing protein [Dyadobacter sp.]|uniref:vWA domain-containing protein n=1 Tax=Dyadobacter sp. TaxID=1914288 RepID=UPI001B1AD523|nr:von Willebrand factor type A domain-containing protein [Dyadobacter sp.]MBO9614725.1 von Willebrand factor type A domain-containing protein [Dyadobacter sp.]
MKTRVIILLAIFLSAFALLPDRVIKGTVTDGSHTPITGVKVSIQGSGAGSLTDHAGRFSIRVPNLARALVFERTGYKSLTMPVTSDSVLNVVLTQTILKTEELAGKGFDSPVQPGQVEKSLAFNRVSAAPATFSGTAMRMQLPTESYKPINENGFLSVGQQPVTTFSVDVDRAAYSNVRRFLNNGQMPPEDAVRIEEMINYFDYDYPQPAGEHPLAITTETTDSPWNPGLKLVHIGLQAKTVSTENLPASNLVFLIDVSGSMNDPNKLPLLKQAFKLLVDQLRAEDKISIVAYAGSAGLVLPPTAGSEKRAIKDALDKLDAGGSTAGGEGIELAYDLAKKHFLPKGNNRVILATDGDFNVGISNESELQKLIEEKRKAGIFLSVMGFGMGNYKDSQVETLADKGNGNYAYIDNIQEARKEFVQEFGGTLFTIAKDVKIQIEFNPAQVQAYRLIGYENRALRNDEFNDDKKDAGDMGSGHTVTAIYEIVPKGAQTSYIGTTDALKYQQNNANPTGHSDEMMTVKVRYKKPDSEKSILFDLPVKATSVAFEKCTENLRFASAVAEFGLLLRSSEYKGKATYADVIQRARSAFGKDEEGYRSEFVQLVKVAQSLDGSRDTARK